MSRNEELVDLFWGWRQANEKLRAHLEQREGDLRTLSYILRTLQETAEIVVAQALKN